MKPIIGTILILLGLLSFFVGLRLGKTRYRSALKSVSYDANMESHLRTEYRNINDVYFDGNLPRDTGIHYANAPDESGVLGITLCETDPLKCNIYIIPKYNLVDPTASATLIHEMCHIATYNEYEDHGPRWQQCMTNLADEGAMKGIW